jgi:predicted RNA-binding protein
MAKRKFNKSDMEDILANLLEDNFKKNGDDEAVIAYVISQYIHLFGEVSRPVQIEQLLGIKNLAKEI